MKLFAAHHTSYRSDHGGESHVLAAAGQIRVVTNAG